MGSKNGNFHSGADTKSETDLPWKIWSKTHNGEVILIISLSYWPFFNGTGTYQTRFFAKTAKTVRSRPIDFLVQSLGRRYLRIGLKLRKNAKNEKNGIIVYLSRSKNPKMTQKWPFSAHFRIFLTFFRNFFGPRKKSIGILRFSKKG